MSNLTPNQWFLGIVFYLLGLSSLNDAVGTFAREGGLNLVSLGISTIGLGGFCFFAGVPSSLILYKTKRIYLNPLLSMWVYSLGLLLYSLGMFLGNGLYPASIGWGIWLLVCSAFFGVMAYDSGLAGRSLVNVSSTPVTNQTKTVKE